MPTGRFKFGGYSASAGHPNVVVDGSPTDGTVLTLTHWPGFPQPPGFHFDLSAEMAFHYLDEPIEHLPAEIVTNNHFDQDGLVGLHAFVDPGASMAHRRLLIDIAAAGDFATFRDRRAARASMAIDAYADADRSPIAHRLVGSYDEQCVALYEETLPLLVSMAVDGQRFRELWDDEDARLTESVAAIATGRVTIEELPEVGLAVATIPDGRAQHGGSSLCGTIVRRRAPNGTAQRDRLPSTAHRPRSAISVRRPIRDVGAISIEADAASDRHASARRSVDGS